MSLAEDNYRVTRQGESAKNWGLRSQIQRAAVSIPSNIAEGFERYSNKEDLSFYFLLVTALPPYPF
jgi:four helix bundle protein